MTRSFHSTQAFGYRCSALPPAFGAQALPRGSVPQVTWQPGNKTRIVQYSLLEASSYYVAARCSGCIREVTPWRAASVGVRVAEQVDAVTPLKHHARPCGAASSTGFFKTCRRLYAACTTNGGVRVAEQVDAVTPFKHHARPCGAASSTGFFKIPPIPQYYCVCYFVASSQ